MDYSKSPIPKYYQIYEELLEQIRGGKYKEQDRFPSDTELVKSYDVSRGTIREAIKLLFQQGYLVREQGKGTFVTYRKIEQNPDKLIGFSELMQKNNIEPSAKVVEKKVENASPYIAELMNVKEDEKIVRVLRVRYGDGQPLIIERSYFNYDLFAPVLEKDLESNSIFKLLYKHTETRLGKATQRIEAITASKTEQEHLGVEIGTPLLQITRLIQTTGGTYFQYSEDVYRSDRISFTTQTDSYEDDHDAFGLPLEMDERF